MTAPIASASSIDSMTSPYEDSLFFIHPSYSGPSPEEDGPHLQRTSCCYLLPDGLLLGLLGLLVLGLLLLGLLLLGLLVLGLLVLGDVDDAPDEGEVPPAPAPLVTPSSFRHFSRSAPTMPRHLLLEVPPGLALLPDGLDELVPGLEGLVPCASDTPESAKSAAAVAAQISFKVASFTCCWGNCWCPCRCCSARCCCCPRSSAKSCCLTC